MASLVYKACKNSPEDTFLISIIKVLRFVNPTSLGSESKLIKVTVEEQSLYLYQSTVELIQKKLSDLKYLDVYKAGDFNKQSISALRKFQKKNKLDITGFPDQNTLLKLLLGRESDPV